MLGLSAKLYCPEPESEAVPTTVKVKIYKNKNAFNRGDDLQTLNDGLLVIEEIPATDQWSIATLKSEIINRINVNKGELYNNWEKPKAVDIIWVNPSGIRYVSFDEKEAFGNELTIKELKEMGYNSEKADRLSSDSKYLSAILK